MGFPPMCVCVASSSAYYVSVSVCAYCLRLLRVCVCVQLICVRRETAGWNQSPFSGAQNKQTCRVTVESQCCKYSPHSEGGLIWIQMHLNILLLRAKALVLIRTQQFHKDEIQIINICLFYILFTDEHLSFFIVISLLLCFLHFQYWFSSHQFRWRYFLLSDWCLKYSVTWQVMKICLNGKLQTGGTTPGGSLMWQQGAVTALLTAVPLFGKKALSHSSSVCVVSLKLPFTVQLHAAQVSWWLRVNVCGSLPICHRQTSD